MVALALAGVIFGLLLTFTEQSSGEISARAGELDIQLRDAKESLRQELEARQEETAAAEREMDRLAALAALRERLFGLIVLDHANGGDIEREFMIWLLTRELAALGPILFDRDAGESWSIAAYLHDESRNDLRCVADFRNYSNDFGERHRRWPVGRGMVGITFRAARELVLSDAESSDLTEVMRDSDDHHAAADRGNYRSVAALPIFRADAYSSTNLGQADSSAVPTEAPPLYGIVVATSDMPHRFTADAENHLAPLRALADAVSMVLMSGDINGALALDESDSEMTAGE